MNPIKIIKYQLYLLQLENYELGRFWKLLFKKGVFPPKKPSRKNLVWTAKAELLFGLAFLSHLFLAFGVVFFMHQNFLVSGILYLVLWVIFIPLYFILYTCWLLFLWPPDYLAKYLIIFRAKSKIKKLTPSSPSPSHQGRGGLVVVGIAGSYGKTTMKEIITQVLGIRYKVLGTPESVNTPVGIARWILDKVDASTEIIVVEMGEHYTGDIAALCKITPPDVAVVTGINEAHLERMKTMENVIATVFEIAGKAKPGAVIVLNGDDNNVVSNYKKFVWPDHKIERFKIEDLRSKGFNQDKLCWEAEAENLGKIEVNLLGEYALGDVDAAIKVAGGLGMSGEEIRKGVKNIKPIEHRLQPIKSASNVLVIDDSYNGNPDGVAEAVAVLSRFAGRRKIYLTPGLVETGAASAEVHREIGRQLAGVADIVILIKNSVTPWIEQGVRQQAADNRAVIASEAKQSNQGKDRHDLSGLAMTEIVWFNTAPEAHAGLKNIIKSGDVILFQNDWGDQYT